MRRTTDKSSVRAFGLLASACLALVLALARPAAAADPEALIKRGNELRQQGRNEEALVLYKRAYASERTPRTAAQLGLAELATDRFVDAEAHLVEGLRARSDAFVVKYRATLEEALATVRSRVARIEVTGGPDGAEVIVNDRPVGRLPRTPPVAVDPGRVEVSVRREGFHPRREVLVLAKGSSEILEVRLEPVPVPVSPVDEGSGKKKNGRTLRIAGLVTCAAGVVAIASGGALRLVAGGKQERIDRDALAGRPYDPANGDWPTFERASTVAFVAGGLALVGGGILWFVGRDTEDATGVTVAPTTHGGMQLTLSGRF